MFTIRLAPHTSPFGAGDLTRLGVAGGGGTRCVAAELGRWAAETDWGEYATLEHISCVRFEQRRTPMKNLRAYGKAPFSVAVIHGGPGAGGEMAPVARELASGWGILEPLQTAASLEGQIEELKTVLEKNGDLPVTLIGFSWGAWLSYIFATDYPAIVKKLILIGSGGYEEKYAAGIRETRLNRLSEEDRTETCP